MPLLLSVKFNLVRVIHGVIGRELQNWKMTFEMTVYSGLAVFSMYVLFQIKWKEKGEVPSDSLGFLANF